MFLGSSRCSLCQDFFLRLSDCLCVDGPHSVQPCVRRWTRGLLPPLSCRCYQTPVRLLLLRKPILKRQVPAGAGSLLYASGRRPGEKVDSCPGTSSEDSAQPGSVFKGKGKRSHGSSRPGLSLPLLCAAVCTPRGLSSGAVLFTACPRDSCAGGLQTVTRNSVGPVLLRPVLRIVLARDSALLRKGRLASRLQSGHHAA